MSASTVTFSVVVKEDGKVKFESSASVPLMQGDNQKKQAVEAWMQMMEAGLKFSQAVRVEE